jgi:hypothetical protein
MISKMSRGLGREAGQLLGDCSRWFKATLTALGVFTWTRTHDCDDKARGFAWLAGVLHRRGRQRGRAEALAIFELWYQPDTGPAHAINVAIRENNQIIYVEPQGPRQITLSSKERQSCSFVR